MKQGLPFLELENSAERRDRMQPEEGKSGMVCRRGFLKASGLAGLGLLSWPAGLSWAEEPYPSKDLTWVIPVKAGGGMDVFARSIAPYLERHLKKASPQAKGGGIRVKNEPAGGGEKGIVSIYNAAPDGYTIGSFVGAYIAERFLFQKDYDILRLTYLIRMDETTRLLVTSKAGPKNWDELVASSKQAPIKWGAGNFGRELHITSIVANDVLGLPVKFIPFGGGTAENINALLRGDIQVVLISDDSAKTLVDAGELRVLLVFDAKSSYPGAPSIRDLGHPELINLTKGHRLLAGPPAMPPEVQGAIVGAFQQAAQDPEFVAWCAKSGFEIHPVYGSELKKLVTEIAEFYREKAPLIKKHLS